MATAFATLESVTQHISRAAQLAVGLHEMALTAFLKTADEREAHESPIEAIFALYWHALRPFFDPEERLTLHSQFGLAPINGRSYRPDFVITENFKHPICREGELAGVLYRWVLIELDGHDFHERTKAQVIDRNQRDRDFQGKGWRVLHFSGSELHRDPDSVLADVINAAGAHWFQYKTAIQAAKVPVNA